MLCDNRERVCACSCVSARVHRRARGLCPWGRGTQRGVVCSARGWLRGVWLCAHVPRVLHLSGGDAPSRRLWNPLRASLVEAAPQHRTLLPPLSLRAGSGAAGVPDGRGGREGQAGLHPRGAGVGGRGRGPPRFLPSGLSLPQLPLPGAPPARRPGANCELNVTDQVHDEFCVKPTTFPEDCV